MPPLAVAVDLGGTQIRAALVAEDGSILARTVAPTPATEGADAVVARIAELAGRVRASAGGAAILGIGLSAPGPLDAENGIALATPTIAGFVDFPLAARLSAATGLPVRLENDAIAAAIGEWRFGAGRGCSHMVYVTLSTGIGGGVIADGRVLRGRKGMAAHIGHMTIVRNGDLCACGHRGCFEAHASGTAFLARARRLAGQRPDTVLGRDGEIASGSAVFEAAEAGDPLALELAAEEAALLGLGFANLLHLYSPETIIVGGGLSNAFDALHPGILTAMRSAALAPFRDVPVLRAGLGDNSGLAGAGALVFEAGWTAEVSRTDVSG